jgi:hypothetical protein
MHENGSNVVLFDPAAAEWVDSKMVRVTGVAVNHEDYEGPPGLAEMLGRTRQLKRKETQTDSGD